MNLGLEGKVCVVTGATRGIGAATATMLKQEGAQVLGVVHPEHERRGLGAWALARVEDQSWILFARLFRQILQRLTGELSPFALQTGRFFRSLPLSKRFDTFALGCGDSAELVGIYEH